jgi:hypothetical protein
MLPNMILAAYDLQRNNYQVNPDAGNIRQSRAAILAQSSKSESRNSKQIRISNDKNSKQKGVLNFELIKSRPFEVSNIGKVGF